MTRATIIELADAIVDELNSSDLQDTMGVTFESRRVYTSEITLEAAEKKLHVLVYPVTFETSNISRNSTLKTPTINVGFVHRPPSDDTLQWLDGLVLAMELASDHFRRLAFAMDAGQRAMCTEAKIDNPYDYEGLRQQKCFESTLSLTYKMGVEA